MSEKKKKSSKSAEKPISKSKSSSKLPKSESKSDIQSPTTNIAEIPNQDIASIDFEAGIVFNK